MNPIVIVKALKEKKDVKTYTHGWIACPHAALYALTMF
jgi:hypothetical protein